MSFPFPMFVPMVAVSEAVPTVEDLTLASSGSSVSTYTFTGRSIGTEAADRLVVLRLMLGHNFNSQRTFSSVTIGGNAATIIEQRVAWASTVTSYTTALAYLVIPTGTTATIVCNVSGGNAASCAVHPVAIYGLSSATPFHTNGATSGSSSVSSLSTTLNVSAGGVQVVATAQTNGGDDHVATGFTELEDVIDTNWRFVRGVDANLPAATGKTIGIASGFNVKRTISAASWR